MPSPYNPQSLNRYSYCLNNPLIYTDPSGHQEYDINKLYAEMTPGDWDAYWNLLEFFQMVEVYAPDPSLYLSGFEVRPTDPEAMILAYVLGDVRASKAAIGGGGSDAEEGKYTEAERKLLIGACYAEGYPGTKDEYAGIAWVIMNRVKAKHFGYDNITDIIYKTGVYGVTVPEGKGNERFQYYNGKIALTDAKSIVGDASPGYIKIIEKQEAARIALATQVVDDVLSGKYADPTKGAMHWGGKKDYDTAGGIFKKAREGEAKDLVQYGGTYFFHF